MQRIDVSDLENLKWELKQYREGTRYGYDVCSFKDEDALNVPSVILNFVRVKPGHIVPEHKHRVKDEYFTVIDGEAKIQTRTKTTEELGEEFVEKGNVFHIPPGTYHRVENIGDLALYLFRVALHNRKGDSQYVE